MYRYENTDGDEDRYKTSKMQLFFAFLYIVIMVD